MNRLLLVAGLLLSAAGCENFPAREDTHTYETRTQDGRFVVKRYEDDEVVCIVGFYRAGGLGLSCKWKEQP